MHAYITKEAAYGSLGAFTARASKAKKPTATATRDITKSLNRKRRYNKLKPKQIEARKLS